MIGGIIAGLVLVGMVGLIALGRKGSPKLSRDNIPEHLGALDQVPIQPLLDTLNKALDDEFMKQVKTRFLQENPKVTEDEYEWRMFELKRYFILTNVLKSAPMFSAEVDEIWHTMILFTQKYQEFSDQFIGRMLHHTPNINPEPAPQERAFFDWTFSQLFLITQYSWKTWGNFFKHPLAPPLLKEFKEWSKESLIEKYFNQTEDNKELVEYLVTRMKEQLIDSETRYLDDRKGSFNKQLMFGDMTALSLVMVFFSYYYFDEYWDQASVYAFARHSHNTSGCTTAVFCGTGSSDHGRHGHDGPGHHGHHCSGGHDGGSSCSSSSCSSCSSCGSGCSS